VECVRPDNYEGKDIEAKGVGAPPPPNNVYPGPGQPDRLGGDFQGDKSRPGGGRPRLRRKGRRGSDREGETGRAVSRTRGAGSGGGRSWRARWSEMERAAPGGGRPRAGGKLATPVARPSRCAPPPGGGAINIYRDLQKIY